MSRVTPSERERHLAQRQIRVGELAADGHTPHDIARIVGAPIQTVHADLDAMGFEIPRRPPGRPPTIPDEHCPHGRRTGHDKWGRTYCRRCTPTDTTEQETPNGT